MRINALALKNLNSLRGEFSLDFDEPPLADAGIFVITGPTGAGKTTILDAICVALYGQTPRLSPGSSAELLTRNTGECFAEVEFTVTEGRFRSRWSRRRARGRADGNLQPTSMELVAISPEGEARIIEDQVRQVIERVELLTGLDFVRFTRSVMLAQGSFASFLKAKDNERAELLERMTGTRLYSFISVQAFNRAREERQRLDELIAINAHLDVMSPDQLAELIERRAVLESEIAAAGQALSLLRDQAATAVRYQELKSAIKETEQGLVRVTVEEEEAAFSLTRLNEAETAQPLLAEVSALDSANGRLDRLRMESSKLAEQCEALHRAEEQARFDRRVLDQEAEGFAETATARDEAIREAERLDEQLRIHGPALAAKQQAVSTCDAEIVAVQGEIKIEGEVLHRSLSRLQALDALLTEHAVDIGLGRDLGEIASSLRELASGRQQFAVNRREQERINAGIGRHHAEASRLAERKAAITAGIATLRSGISEVERRCVDTLQGRAWDEVEAALAANRRRLELVEAVLALAGDCRRLTAERSAKEERRSAIGKTLVVEADRRQQMAEDQGQAEKILSLLEDRQRLAAQVAKYETDRGRLVDGGPCPLCGSLSHPWQDGAPVVDRDGEEVNAQRQKVTALIAGLATLDGRMQELSSLDTTLGEEIAAVADSLVQGQVALTRAMAEAALLEPDSAGEIRAQLSATVAADQQRLLEARKIVAERDRLQQQLAADEKAESLVALELANVHALIKDQVDNVNRLKDQGETLCEQGKALGLELEVTLAKYGIALPPSGQEEAVGELLRKRWQRFDQARQDRNAVEGQRLESERVLAVLSTREAGLTSRRDEDQQRVVEGQGVCETLSARRRAVLGSESVDTARHQLAEGRADFAARIKASDGLIAELATRRASVTGAFTENAQQVERMVEESQRLFQTVAERLLAAGFVDLPAVRQALLSEEELDALRAVRDGFIRRRQGLTDRLKEAVVQLQDLEPAASGLELVALQRAILQAGEALAKQQQELGALGETIRSQVERVAEHQQRSVLIDSQRREQRHWQLLSDLIGSADGKKFRRFVQGLTLDHLIYLANRQLVRLTDRYLLRRHQDEELGLEIIDTYQADAIRPTGTLSGGEEFLVSLALALGLASLSGQTRIDSLFLDEGFGTLDTDTLETALSALAALHETGKTIGVISHVDALKERIPVQIRLRKLAGGFSEISVVA